MDIELLPGAYVVAVSGGVDSVVLLDMLSKRPDLELVVAHFDHGIRTDSDEDRLFVEMLAQKYGLPFVYEAGHLGSGASEATARQARYDFLHRVRESHKAQAIVTAHHQDDLLETALLNLLRGTNRKGLSSLKSTDMIKRPLLHVPKQELIEYAQDHGLAWHEDSTNANEAYRRNYVRRQLLSQLSASDRLHLIAIVSRAKALNETIDDLLTEQLHIGLETDMLDREWFIGLPHVVAREVLVTWLRQVDGRQLDKKQVERLVILAKTLSHGKLVDVDAGRQLKITRRELALVPRDR